VAGHEAPDTLPRDLASFLDWRERQDRAVEFLGLQPKACLPRGRRASLIKGNLLAALDEALDGRSDVVVGESVELRTADAFSIAMLVVASRTACLASPPCYLESDDITPLVIVETATPETACRVHAEKWEAYRHIPSLRHYLVVEAEQRLVRLRSRKREMVFEELFLEAGPVPLQALGITLDVDSIYAGVIDG
jgi:hypothetical protein